MDLLNDKGHVPAFENNAHSLVHDIQEVFGSIAQIFRTNTEDYNFMDLLNDYGYVPSNDNWV